jgi:hypothetical protein
MAGITLAQVQAKLTEWMAADTAVASGQSYTINNRALTRANAREIRENIDYWEAKTQKLSAGGGTGGIQIKGVTPC